MHLNKHFYKLFFLILLFNFILNKTNASHLIGGDITYTYLGNNTYQIQMQVFRDCKDPKDFDNPAAITIYQSNGQYIDNRLVKLAQRNIISNALPNPCLIPPPGICVERGLYIDTVVLPPSVFGYDLSYETCCHNATVQNILFPNLTGMTLTTHIPATNITFPNSSAKFDSITPVFICVNEVFNYNFSVSDADGDNLVYTLCTPYDGLSGNPASAPPYTPITWAAGFSATNPLPTSTGINFNSQTGLLSFTPNAIGQFDICVCIEEYRNGQLINTGRREIQLNVVNCQTTTSIVQQTNFCQGLQVSFNNISTNATNYFWNFGDPTTLLDTSTLQSPTYTYADTGTYQVMLIAINNNGACRDTSYATYKVYPVLAPTILPNYTQCFNNNSFSFQPSGTFTSNAQFNWMFGANASPQNSILTNPSNVTYDTSGVFPFSVIVSQYGCYDTLNSIVTILPSPNAGFYSNDSSGCAPLLVNIINTSSSSSALQYNWLINGINDTIMNPSLLMNNAGQYTIQLIVTDINGCYDTMIKNNYITVYPKPIAVANVNPVKTDIISNVTFQDLTSGSHSTHFDLGDGTFETFVLFEHNYQNEGMYDWYLIVTNDYGCKDTTEGQIEVGLTSLVYVPNSFSPNDDGLNDSFIPVIINSITATLEIFDRWGNSILKTNEVEKGWNGKWKNKICQQDVYVYKLDIVFNDGKEKSIFGSVTLVR